MAWDPITQPTDKAIIAGRVSPGICEVIGAGSPRKWDELAGYGMSGAILIYRGIKLSYFSLRFNLYNDEHWAEWVAFRPLMTRPPIGRVARALDIIHPVLNEVDIHQMVIENVQAPLQTDHGVWLIEVNCIEWRVHKQSIGKPDGSESTPEDPWDKRIETKTDEFNQLANDPGNP